MWDDVNGTLIPSQTTGEYLTIISLQIKTELSRLH